MSAPIVTTIVDEVRISGTLHESARLTYRPGIEPEAVLSFEVHPAVGMPYRVRQELGTDPSTHIAAEAKVHALRRGAVVQVYAKGLRAQTDHGVAALVLLDVSGIFLINNPAAHIEAKQTEGA